MNLLQVGNAIADEISLSRPTALVGNTTSDEAAKLLRQITKTAKMLAGRHDWSTLRKEHVFTTVAAAEQSAALPSAPADLLRFVKDTFFNRTRQWRVVGPLTAEEWQSRQASSTSSNVNYYIMRGGVMSFSPVPSAGDTCAYEYISTKIARDSNNTEDRADFEADDDIPAFDAELLIMGAIWRYRQSEGLEYGEQFREFETRLADMIKMDGGRRRIDMSGADYERVPRPPIMPDAAIVIR